MVHNKSLIWPNNHANISGFIGFLKLIVPLSYSRPFLFVSQKGRIKSVRVRCRGIKSRIVEAAVVNHDA